MQDERTLAAQHALEMMELKPNAVEILLQQWRDEAVAGILGLVSPVQSCEMLVEYEQC